MSKRVKTHVKKNDEVVVISGNHKGETGKVLQVFPEKEQVLVEGVRLIKKHARRTQDRPEGGIIEKEGPIHISNVKIEAKKSDLLGVYLCNQHLRKFTKTRSLPA